MDLIVMFLAFSVWGWIGFIAFSFFVIVALEWESGVWAAGVLITAVAMLWFFSGAGIPTLSDLFHWLDVNWLRVMVYACVYVGIGIGWGIVKWLFYLHNVADDIKDYAHRYGTTLSPTESKRKWDVRTDPKDNKSRITMWMLYWPWSALWTLTNDPIRRFFNMVYRLLTNTYQKMADWVYRSQFPDSPAQGG